MPKKATELRKNMESYFKRYGWDETQHINEKRPVRKKKKAKK